MATITTTLRLVDQMSQPLNDVNKATQKVERGFKALDVAAGALLAQGVNAVGGMVQKFTALGDSLVQTEARINLINDGLQTSAQLNDMIFESAQRSRTSYIEMTDAVGKMAMMAGDAFASTEQVVAFNEILGKTFKVSGTGAEQQASAMLQLTQSLGAGRMQGEEFNAVMEASPMIIQSIADYMGVAKGEVKGLASDGLVTSEVIVNAMFAASEEIEEMFAGIPMTAGEKMQMTRDQFIYAFSDIIKQFNGVLANGITIGMQFVMNNFNTLALMLMAIAGYFTFVGVRAAMAWTMANLPLVLMISAIGFAIAVLSQLGVQFDTMAGIAVGAISYIGSAIYNMVATAWNLFANLFNFITSSFAKISSMLGVEVNAPSINTMEFKNANEVTKAGFEKGKAMAGNISANIDKALASGFAGKMPTGFGMNAGSVPKGIGGAPKIGGGKLDSVGKIEDDIKISEEDLKLLTDISTRGFRLNYQQVTPQLTAYFGDIRESIDIDSALDALGSKFNDYVNSNLITG